MCQMYMHALIISRLCKGISVNLMSDCHLRTDRGMHTAEVCSESAPRVPVGGGDTNSCPKLEQQNEDKLSSIHIH